MKQLTLKTIPVFLQHQILAPVAQLEVPTRNGLQVPPKGLLYFYFTPFLFRQERCPKEADLRGVELIAPAIKATLLRISRPALTTPLEHLNLKPVPSKNVPIFAW